MTAHGPDRLGEGNEQPKPKRIKAEREPGFALLPGEIQVSDAYRALPDYACRCLFALAAYSTTSRDPQYRRTNGPGNNGDLSLPVSIAKRFGIRPAWRVSAGLAMLRHAGLIEITRAGRVEGGKGIAQLYALTWLPIAPSAKYDQPRTVPRDASNEWRRFQAPNDWHLVEQRVRQKAQGFNPDRVSRFQTSGTKTTLSYKASVTEPIKTSVTKGQFRRSRRLVASHEFGPGGPRPAGRAELKAKLQKLRTALPHLGAHDLAKALQRPNEVGLIQALLAELEGGSHAR